jgi:hypothetical protein
MTGGQSDRKSRLLFADVKNGKAVFGRIGTSSTIRFADGPPSPQAGKARLTYGEREMIVYPFGNFFFMIL